MRQILWLFLPLIAVLFFFSLILGAGCNMGGISDWLRTWPDGLAIYFSIFMALGLVVSILTLLFRILRISQNPGSGTVGILFVLALTVVGAATVVHVSKQYCHTSIRENKVSSR